MEGTTIDFKRSRNIYQLVKSVDTTPVILPRKESSSSKGSTTPRQHMPSLALSSSSSSEVKGSKTASSEFIRAYDEGLLPCRIWHGAAHKSVKWDAELSSMEPKRITFFLLILTSGLDLQAYPYNWLVQNGLQDVLHYMASSAPAGGYRLSEPDGRKLSQDLRKALSSQAALNVTCHLASFAEALHETNLEQILGSIVTPLSKLKSQVLKASNAAAKSSKGKIKDLPFSRSINSSNDPWLKMADELRTFKDALDIKSPDLVRFVKSKWPTFGTD